jgi:hypothetical protein
LPVFVTPCAPTGAQNAPGVTVAGAFVVGCGSEEDDPESVTGGCVVATTTSDGGGVTSVLVASPTTAVTLVVGVATIVTTVVGVGVRTGVRVVLGDALELVVGFGLVEEPGSSGLQAARVRRAMAAMAARRMNTPGSWCPSPPERLRHTAGFRRRLVRDGLHGPMKREALGGAVLGGRTGRPGQRSLGPAGEEIPLAEQLRGALSGVKPARPGR